MKKITLVISLAALLITSCKKETKEDEVKPSSNPSFTMVTIPTVSPSDTCILTIYKEETLPTQTISYKAVIKSSSASEAGEATLVSSCTLQNSDTKMLIYQPSGSHYGSPQIYLQLNDNKIIGTSISYYRYNFSEVGCQ